MLDLEGQVRLSWSVRVCTFGFDQQGQVTEMHYEGLYFGVQPVGAGETEMECEGFYPWVRD